MKSEIMRLVYYGKVATLLLLLIVVVGCINPSSKGDKKDWSAESIENVVSLAGHGDPDAQSELGRRYYNGDGVEKNYEEAIKWYEKAIEQGSARANHLLGICYMEGNGMPTDTLEGIKCWRLAAEQGYAPSQYNMGLSYYHGTSVKQCYEEAVKWFHKAAEQGFADAQRYLGNCYFEGNGVKQNYEEAAKWFRKAAEQGDIHAQYNLGICYSDGMGVPQDWQEAVKWTRKAAEQGDMYAQYNLGICYLNGDGVTENAKEAVKWVRKAAEQGFATAQYDLGVCYLQGYGVEQSDEEAEKWLSKAEEQGYVERDELLPEGWKYGRLEKYNGVTLEERNMVSQYDKYVKALQREDLKGCASYVYPDAVTYFRNAVSRSYSNEDIIKEFMKPATGISRAIETFSSMGLDFEIIIDSVVKKVSTSNAIIYVFTTGANVYDDNTCIHATEQEMDIGISLDNGKDWTFITINEDTPKILRLRFDENTINQIIKH